MNHKAPSLALKRLSQTIIKLWINRLKIDQPSPFYRCSDNNYHYLLYMIISKKNPIRTEVSLSLVFSSFNSNITRNEKRIKSSDNIVLLLCLAAGV